MPAVFRQSTGGTGLCGVARTRRASYKLCLVQSDARTSSRRVPLRLCIAQVSLYSRTSSGTQPGDDDPGDDDYC